MKVTTGKSFLVVLAALAVYLVSAAASVVAGSLVIWLLYQFAAWMVR
jgi:hypothetical protein